MSCAGKNLFPSPLKGEGGRRPNEEGLANSAESYQPPSLPNDCPITETVLLGVIALQVPRIRLEWDSANLPVKHAPDVNQFIHTEDRQDWTP